MSKENSELALAMDLLEKEKGISREVIKDALEQALIHAYKRNYEQAANVEVEFDADNGTITVFSVKEVVEEVEDEQLQVSLNEALQIHRAYEVGDTIKFEVTPKDFGRIATQTAKHVIMQRLREAERENVYEEYIVYQDEVLTGVVDRQDNRFVYVTLDRAEAVMPQREQIPGEVFDMDDRIKVYVQTVDKTTRGPQIIVSRAAPEFLRRLFEEEVPEIYEGIVEVKGIAREAGDRSKVAVASNDPNIDPVGTCVGPSGARVQAIVRELNMENMDIIEYDEDPAVFIKNAMSPAKVIEVVTKNEEEHAVIVVVPDDQLSLAIGKRGQNARLAARLTGYKIDIKSEEDYADYLAEQALLAQEAEEEAAQVADLESLAEDVEAEADLEAILDLEEDMNSDHYGISEADQIIVDEEDSFLHTELTDDEVTVVEELVLEDLENLEEEVEIDEQEAGD